MAVWGKLYGSLHGSPKWRRASRTARGLWCTAASWCIDQEGSEGVVPTDMLKSLDGTQADVDCLVRVGLWDVVDGGWRFHDWDEHQVSRERMNARRKAGAERQQRFRDGLGNAVTNGATDASVTAYRRDETREDEKEHPAPAPAGSRRKPERPLPDGWEPNDAHRANAAERGIDVAREAEAFRNHAQANDRRARDWDAAFRTWLSRARPSIARQSPSPVGPAPEPRSEWDRIPTVAELRARDEAERRAQA